MPFFVGAHARATHCAHAPCLLCCCVLPVLLPPVITCTRTAPLPLRPGRFTAVSAAATAATAASQALLTLLDSPLNKVGLLQVYIHTNTNVLIEVNPHIRIPRTFKRFCGLMGACA